VTAGGRSEQPTEFLQPLGLPGRLSTVGEVALGDKSAFEEAYREHSLALTRLAWLLTGSREKAEDTVHEVFLRYLRVDPQPDSPWAYLRRMVVNQVIDDGRKSATEARFRPDQELAFEDPALDETWDALGMLPEDQRRVLILRYYADLPLTEIADVMGAPMGTVKSWIHRGLERLREAST
jgi:RNA polymerase sigma factor (sigma-70 family)